MYAGEDKEDVNFMRLDTFRRLAESYVAACIQK